MIPQPNAVVYIHNTILNNIYTLKIYDSARRVYALSPYTSVTITRELL